MPISPVDSDGTLLADNLIVSGELTVVNSLIVTDDVTIAGNTVIAGDLEVSGDFVFDVDLTSVQPLLVSGNNIKTVNGTSLLGIGNIPFIAAEVTLIGQQTLTNKTIARSVFSGGTKETIGIVAFAATGTVNYDVLTQQLLYWTSPALANWTLNVRGSASETLSSIMAVGETLSIVIMATNGTTPYYNNVLTIDSVSNVIKWESGTAPIAGNASSVDMYSYAIVKTATAAYTVFGAQTKFA